MVMSPLRLKIHREFVRDLRVALRSEVPAKAGHLDEAIAAGFGFKTRAALLRSLQNNDHQVCLNAPAFKARMLDFGVSVSETMFFDTVISRIDPGKNTPLYNQEDLKMGVMTLARLPTEEELGDISMESHEFLEAFNKSLVPGNNFQAKVKIIGDGNLEIDGWIMPIKPESPWYSVK